MIFALLLLLLLLLLACVREKMHGLAIRRNTIQCMQAILEATILLEIPLEEEAAAAAARMLRIDESSELSPDVVQVRKGAWCARASACAFALAVPHACVPCLHTCNN